MNKLLKLEELGQFLLSIVLFNQLPFSWWIFPACLLLPDFSMLGYVVNNKIGAWSYNIFHHKLLGIFLYCLGLFTHHETIMLAGIILFGHAAMDRIFGYGLKYNDDFKHTHLGKIGK
ncbi:DUF4260 domain-containing protein [Wenyingzhuangia sp. IMCC45467]